VDVGAGVVAGEAPLLAQQQGAEAAARDPRQVHGRGDRGRELPLAGAELILRRGRHQELGAGRGAPAAAEVVDHESLREPVADAGFPVAVGVVGGDDVVPGERQVEARAQEPAVVERERLVDARGQDPALEVARQVLVLEPQVGRVSGRVGSWPVLTSVAWPAPAGSWAGTRGARSAVKRGGSCATAVPETRPRDKPIASSLLWRFISARS
jgi:hypothetical protein